MRRADLIVIACTVLGGCMKIYPDPELPDIEVSWYVEDCGPATGDVVVEIAGVDDPTDVQMRTVPCSDLGVTLADVSRERYHVAGTLLDVAGEPFSRWDQDVDLRDGISERVELYLGAGSNVRVAFGFDSGATCESLNVGVVVGRFLFEGDPTNPFDSSSACVGGALFTSLPAAHFTVALRAFGPDGIVAVSESADFDVPPTGLAEVGPLTLVPCGTSCPTLPP